MTRLADVNCTKMRFSPGDRLIVRVDRALDFNARKRLQRAVEQWTGGDVPVLVVDPRVSVEKIEAFKLGHIDIVE